MKEITLGDIMHVYGSFGLQMDYTVRLCLRMTDAVDGGAPARGRGEHAKALPLSLGADAKRRAEALVRGKRRAGGATFVQSDEEHVRMVLTALASRNRTLI